MSEAMQESLSLAQISSAVVRLTERVWELENEIEDLRKKNDPDSTSADWERLNKSITKRKAADMKHMETTALEAVYLAMDTERDAWQSETLDDRDKLFVIDCARNLYKEATKLIQHLKTIELHEFREDADVPVETARTVLQWATGALKLSHE